MIAVAIADVDHELTFSSSGDPTIWTGSCSCGQWAVSARKLDQGAVLLAWQRDHMGERS